MSQGFLKGSDLKTKIGIFITEVLPRLYDIYAVDKYYGKEKSGKREMLQFDNENEGNSPYDCVIRFIYKEQLLPEKGIT